MSALWAFPDDSGFSASNAEPVGQPDPDALLAHLVSQRLKGDPLTRCARISVTVQNRVVILRGRVESPEARRAASGHAWDMPMTVDVCNSLRVPGGTGR